MDHEEKKIKLEELPDQGSEPDQVALPPRPKKPAPEPRLKDIQKLNPAEKSELLGQRWFFDKRVWKKGWMVIVLVLFALEKSGHMEQFSPANKARLNEETSGASELMFSLFDFEFILRHPLFFSLLIPLFFKFTDTEGFAFTITFNGIDAVKSIDYPYSKPERVFLKWGDMDKVEKRAVLNREVIEIHDAKGPRIQLIWDIDEVKKKAIKQILKGLVATTHPFRIFIEKEVA